jgi:hypothetical protein
MICVRSIVKRRGSAAIRCSMIRSVIDQKLCDRTLKRGSCHMQSRIASVKIMVDLGEEKIFGVLTAGTNLSRSGGKTRIGHYSLTHRINVTVHDVLNEF